MGWSGRHSGSPLSLPAPRANLVAESGPARLCHRIQHEPMRFAGFMPVPVNFALCHGAVGTYPSGPVTALPTAGRPLTVWAAGVAAAMFCVCRDDRK